MAKQSGINSTLEFSDLHEQAAIYDQAISEDYKYSHQAYQELVE